MGYGRFLEAFLLVFGLKCKRKKSKVFVFSTYTVAFVSATLLVFWKSIEIRRFLCVIGV